LEFSSYIFFCQSAGCGIFFEYTDYIRFIKREEEYKGVPSTIEESLWRLVGGLVHCGLYVFLNQYFPKSFVSSDEFGTLPYWK
jgi:hypothetical protein